MSDPAVPVGEPPVPVGGPAVPGGGPPYEAMPAARGGVRLTVGTLLRRAETVAPAKEIVTISAAGDRAAVTWGAFADRVRRLAGALRAMGVRPGDRVATFAWSGARHFELFLAVPVAGAVLHPINVRFSDDQIVWVIRHADDSVIFVSASLTGHLARLLPRIGPDRRFVVIPDGAPVHPAFAGVPGHDDLVASGTPASADGTGEPAEDAAACVFYTSGTTGDPKGIVHSHRSVVLHSMGVCMADAFAVRERDVVLPLTPLFHAAAWGLPYAAALTGAGLVFTPPHLDPHTVAHVIERERVTISAGVPTFWLAVDEAEPPASAFASLERVICGGSAVPEALVRAYRERGVTMQQGLGLSEMFALVALTNERAGVPERSGDAVHATQGLPVAGVEVRLVGEDGAELPRDGRSAGELEVRSVWGATAYHRPGDAGGDTAWRDGWLRTGDVGTIDPYGYIRLTDRSKDLIKSGGEWISSIALESLLMDHPGVAAAAVIAVPDARWAERPLAVVVRRAGHSVTDKDLIEHLGAADLPRWWIPDRYEFVSDLPLTATNKFDKKLLRSRYA